MKKYSRVKLTYATTAIAVFLSMPVSSVSADLHKMSSRDLIIAGDIGTRFRINVDVNAGDKVTEIYGGSTDIIFINPMIGAAIFQMLDLQTRPQSLEDALNGFSTSTVPLSGFRVPAIEAFTIPVVPDRRPRGGTLPIRRGAFTIPTVTGKLPSGFPVGNLLTYSEPLPLPIVSIPAPGAIALLGFAGLALCRRRR